MKLPQIPSNWSWKTVRELGTSDRPAVKAGPFGSSLKKEFYVESGFRIYGQEQVIAGDLSVGNYYISQEKFDSLKSCEVKAGDILISLVGTFGKILVVPDVFEPGIINPRLVRLALDSKIINPHFFSRFFRSPLARFQMEMHTHGGTMDILNTQNISELLIPIPPIDEQRRIADILDRADAIRRKRQEAIRLTEELLRSAFLEMFGDPAINSKEWKTVPMKDVVSQTQYGTAEKANSEKVGVPVLRMNNLTYKGEINLDDIKWCSIPSRDEEKFTVQRGDLLFNRTNSPELVGKTAVWRSDEKYAYAGYLVRVRFQEKVALSEYVSAYLNSSFGKKYLFEKAKPSNNMSNFSASEFLKIPLLLPPIELQKRFILLADAARSSVDQLKEAVIDADSLFNSLLQRAFRGEI